MSLRVEPLNKLLEALKEQPPNPDYDILRRVKEISQRVKAEQATTTNGTIPGPVKIVIHK